MAGRINNKSVLVRNSDSIKKSSEFSMAKMNQGLSLNQMQLFAYAIYSTQQDGTTNFRKIDFEAKFNLEYQSYRAKEDSLRLIDLKVSTEELESDSFSFWNIFMGMEYDKGLFKFEWNPKMIPHILGLKNKFIMTDLTVTSQFKSSFSWTLYDYLKANYGCWYKTISKDELMKLFGVENKKTYIENSGRFKNTVLDVAIAEINAFTEIEAKYEDVKNGRSIGAFQIFWSSGSKIHKASKKQINILESLVDIVFEDVPMYMEIKDEINRERALSIIRDLQSVKYRYLDPEIGLTAEHCNKLTKKANSDLEALNSLLEMEGKSPLKPQVPLFNWLLDN